MRRCMESEFSRLQQNKWQFKNALLIRLWFYGTVFVKEKMMYKKNYF